MIFTTAFCFFKTTIIIGFLLRKFRGFFLNTNPEIL